MCNQSLILLRMGMHQPKVLPISFDTHLTLFLPIFIAEPHCRTISAICSTTMTFLTRYLKAWYEHDAGKSALQVKPEKPLYTRARMCGTFQISSLYTRTHTYAYRGTPRPTPQMMEMEARKARVCVRDLSMMRPCFVALRKHL